MSRSSPASIRTRWWCRTRHCGFSRADRRKPRLPATLGRPARCSLPPANAARLTGNDFFPSLISDPFHSGLVLVFAIAALMMVVAAIASWYAGVRAADELSAPDAGERLGEEPETYAPVEGEEVGELTGPLAHALRFPTAAPKDAS